MEKQDENVQIKEALNNMANNSIISMFHQVHSAMFRLANKMIEASSVPIKMEQLPILMTLHYFKEQTLRSLSDLCKRDKSSVHRTVQILKEKGLLTHKKDKSDARKKLILLTDTGEFVANQVEDLAKNVDKEIGKALTQRSKEELLNDLKISIKRLDTLTNS